MAQKNIPHCSPEETSLITFTLKEVKSNKHCHYTSREIKCIQSSNFIVYSLNTINKKITQNTIVNRSVRKSNI